MKICSRRVFALLLLLVMLGGGIASSDAQPAVGSVLMVSIKDEITEVTATMVGDALEIAEAQGMHLVIVRLNTPGGEVGAVKEIMDLFETSAVPVCSFVYPPAATAWSGGTYILMASSIAAMASGTTIGSCQPAYSTGQPINYTKYVNAYEALMKHHASLHSRNETLAGLFVRENVNVGPEEALEKHVIEVVADDVGMLLRKLDGLTLVQLQAGAGTLRWKVLPNLEAERVEAVQRRTFKEISSVETVEYAPGIGVTVQEILFSPIISSLLLILGIYIFLAGLHTPGYGTEIIGALCLLLALVGMSAIGLTVGAIMLFSVGVLLIVADLKLHVGALAILGVACLVLGSLLIFPSPQWLLYYQVSEQIRTVLLAGSLLASFFFGLIAYKVAAARRLKVVTGSEVLLGSIGVAVGELKPRGEIRLRGEFWQAKAEGDPILSGESVKVVRREGLLLVVKRVEEKV